MTDPQPTAQPLPQGHAVGPELIYSTRERDAAIREEGRRQGLREAAEIARAMGYRCVDGFDVRCGDVNDIAAAIEAKAGEKS